MTSPATRAKPSSGLVTLDAAFMLLGVLVLVLVVRLLRFDDPNPFYNAWSYLLAIPTVLIATSMLTHVLANDLVEKSVQLGFLISVLVHLFLTLFAINVVLFREPWPSKSNQVAAETTSPMKMPKYFEQTNPQNDLRPDYLQPVKTDSTKAEKAIDPDKRPDEPAKLDAMATKDNLEPTLADKPFEQPRKEVAPSQPAITSTAKQLDRPDPTKTVDNFTSMIEVPETEVQKEPDPQALMPADLQPDRIGPDLTRQDTNPSSIADSAFMNSPLPGQPEKPNVAPKLGDRSLAKPKSNDTEIDKALDRISEALSIRPDAKQLLERSQSSASELAGSSVPVPQLPSSSAVADQSIDLSTEQDTGILERSKDFTKAGNSGKGTVPTMSTPQLVPSLSRASELGIQQRSKKNTSRMPAENSFLTDPRFAQQGKPNGSRARESNLSTSPPAANQPIAIGPLDSKAVSQSLSQSLSQGDGTEALAPSLDSMTELNRSELYSKRLGDPKGTSKSGRESALSPSIGSPALNIVRDSSSTARVDIARKGLDSVKRDIAMPEIKNVELTTDRFKRPDVGGPKIARSAVPIPAPAFSKRLSRNRESEDESFSELGSLGPQTEAAIERGLQFLARYQRGDGSWSLDDFKERVEIQSPTAATALALLAFQGAGYTHQQFKYEGNCKGAVQWFRANQKSNGDLYVPTDAKSDSNAWLYSHSIATLALCESYGMTQDPEIKDNAQRAINFLIQSQDPQAGGWRYQPRMGSDTSVTGWCMMALKSAELSGLEVPKESYVQIEKWLNGSQASEREKFLYRYNWQAPDTPTTRHGRVPTPVMTSVGLLMRLYLGWRRDNANMTQGADWLLQRLPAEGTVENPQRDTYYWYYSTQVLFHMGGNRWKTWYGSLYPILIRSQMQSGEFDGSWEPNGQIPDAWGRFGGRLYVTTLNLLSLEVYYRHLPIYNATAD